MADYSLLERSLLALKLLGTSRGDVVRRIEAAYAQWIPIMPRDLEQELRPRLTSLRKDYPRLFQNNDLDINVYAEEFADLCTGAVSQVLNQEREEAFRSGMVSRKGGSR